MYHESRRPNPLKTVATSKRIIYFFSLSFSFSHFRLLLFWIDSAFRAFYIFKSTSQLMLRHRLLNWQSRKSSAFSPLRQHFRSTERGHASAQDEKPQLVFCRVRNFGGWIISEDSSKKENDEKGNEREKILVPFSLFVMGEIRVRGETCLEGVRGWVEGGEIRLDLPITIETTPPTPPRSRVKEGCKKREGKN